MVHLSGGVGDGCGAHARLVGEDTSGYADAKHRKERSFGMKGPFEDGPERTVDSFMPDNQHCRSQKQIDDGRERDQHLGHFADALRPAQHHRSNKKSEDAADEQMID